MPLDQVEVLGAAAAGWRVLLAGADTLLLAADGCSVLTEVIGVC